MSEINTPFGRAYEDFVVGDTIYHWPGRTVTDTDDMIFSLLALNQHPLHIDANYASQTQFGKNLFKRTVVFSIAVEVTVKDISGAAIAMVEYENVKHLNPTFHGDTLYRRTNILTKRESNSKNDRGVVQVETFLENQQNE